MINPFRIPKHLAKSIGKDPAKLALVLFALITIVALVVLAQVAIIAMR
jgi:hypothetical protein